MKRNYTFTDLVFTLAAILLCGGVLAATVQNTAGKSNVVRCAENMKNLGSATFRYAEDHNGRLPESGFLKDNWKRSIIPYLFTKKGQDITKAVPFFQCPADKNQLPAYMGKNPSYVGKNSYCANAYVIDIRDVDLDNDHVKGGQELKKLYGPDTIILFAEDHSRNNSIGLGPSVKFDRKGEYEYTVPWGTVKNDPAKRGYHGSKNNFLMLDGAVEFDRYENTVNANFNKWVIRFF